MVIFEMASGVFKSTADKYKKRGEEAFVSFPVELNGKKYRQIIFNKMFFGKVKERMSGIIFVNEDGSLVESTNIKRELTEMFYNIEIIFGDEHLKKLSKAITAEKDILRDEEDFELINLVLEKFKKEGFQGIDIIVTVLTRLPNFKRENNKALEEFINKAEEYNKTTTVLNREIIGDVKFSYRNILIKNFQRIKLINKGRMFYDPILKETRKRRRKIMNRLTGVDNHIGMLKLEDTMAHLKKVVSVYDKILDLSEDGYEKYLKEMEKKNISERIALIR